MTDWRPQTLEDLLAMDEAEVQEGYRDGSRGEPEPGDNRSIGYRQGWRAGARDARRIEYDSHDLRLTQIWAEFLRSPEGRAWVYEGMAHV